MRFKKPASSIPDVDMTPMIDIVFQLIAFFMVITNFEQTQADERVILPKDQLAMPPQVKRPKELTINIGFFRNKDGEKLDPSAYIFYAGESLRLEEFEPKLRLEAQLFRDQGTEIDDVTVVIRADGETPTGMVQGLIKMAQDPDIKFTKFAIKARQTVAP